MAQKKKISLIGNDARAALLRGVDYLVDAVQLTLGPSGRNFASGVRGGPVAISNDGVSLSKEIMGRNEFEDMGVRAVREAATKTNDKVGDGTTSAMVMTRAILKLPALNFDADIVGADSLKATEQLKEEGKIVIEKLVAMARPITNKEELVAVARVSVRDPKLAELVGGAQWEVGRDGTVMAEEHNMPHDEVEFVYGVRVDNGLGAGEMMNDVEKQALILKDTRILVTNHLFNTADEVRRLNGLFEKLIAEGVKGIVLMGKAFDVTAIGLCAKNVELFFSGKGGFPIYPINAPYENTEEIMADLAAATGGKYIKDSERNLESIGSVDVGLAKKVFVKRYEGIITGEKSGVSVRVDEMVKKRVDKIKENLGGQISPFEKRQLSARLAQLTAGTAIIKVGAETEQERKFKKDKVDDCVNTVKAALQDGVVPGGGQALMTIANEMKGSLIESALRSVHYQIFKNSGPDLVIPEWVQDPVAVVKTGFEKALSIATSLATTEVLVTWEWEKPWPSMVQNLAEDDEE